MVLSTSCPCRSSRISFLMEKSNPASPGTVISIMFLWLTQEILQNKHHFIYSEGTGLLQDLSGCRLCYSEFSLPDGPKSLNGKRNLRSRSQTQTAGRNIFSSCQAHALPKVTLWLRAQQFNQNLAAQQSEGLPHTAQKHKAEKEWNRENKGWFAIK